MNLENVKLSQLRALAAIAEYGNFSEAGSRLAVSQSAVSHAIATLEQELGVVLLVRGRHGATLTSVGERILAHAQIMLRSLEDIGKEAAIARGLQGGAVRVACFRSVATHVLARVIGQFRERFPQIGVSMLELESCEQLEQAVREGRADLCLTLLPTLYELDAQELLRDEYLVLFPPTYTVPNPLTWQALSSYPLILSPDDDSCGTDVNDHFTRLQQSLKPTYEVREDSTVVSMVSQGLGVGILPRLAAEPIPPDIRIRGLPVPLERVIGVATSAETLLAPAVYAFLDTLKDMRESGQLIAGTNDESRRHQVIPVTFPRGSGEVRQL